MMKLVICGFIGAGKSTVCDILQNEHGFAVFNFADKLKKIVSVIFNWPLEMLQGVTPASRIVREQKDLYWSKALGRDFTPRIALQQVGSAMRAGVSAHVWIYSLERDVACMPKDADIVIGDARYPNEIQSMRALGAKLVHVQRETPLWLDAAKHLLATGERLEGIPLPHETEYAWINTEFDYVLKNCGTKEELAAQVAEMVGGLRCRGSAPTTPGASGAEGGIKTSATEL